MKRAYTKNNSKCKLNFYVSWVGFTRSWNTVRVHFWFNFLTVFFHIYSNRYNIYGHKREFTEDSRQYMIGLKTDILDWVAAIGTWGKRTSLHLQGLHDGIFIVSALSVLDTTFWYCVIIFKLYNGSEIPFKYLFFLHTRHIFKCLRKIYIFLHIY